MKIRVKIYNSNLKRTLSGTLNRDCWYLYTLNPLNKFLSGRVDVEPDQTIEILMTELDPEIMETFTKKRCRNGREATKVISRYQIW